MKIMNAKRSLMVLDCLIRHCSKRIKISIGVLRLKMTPITHVMKYFLYTKPDMQQSK